MMFFPLLLLVLLTTVVSGCRWIVFIGSQPFNPSGILVHATHALIKQVDIQQPVLPFLDQGLFHDDEKACVRNHRSNKDGWGIAWYDSQGHIHRNRSGLSADTDPDFHMVAEDIVSKIVFGHIRAATVSKSSSTVNSHPFMYKNTLMWMHNGGIDRAGIESVFSERMRGLVYGTTDSEVAGGLFSQFLHDRECNVEYEAHRFLSAMLLTIEELKIKCGHSSMNFAVSDGSHIIATRFRSSIDEDPPSLYMTRGCDWDDSTESMNDFSECDSFSFLIASEPVSRNNSDQWQLLLKDQLLYIDTATGKHHLFCLSQACVTDAHFRNEISEYLSLENIGSFFRSAHGAKEQ